MKKITIPQLAIIILLVIVNLASAQAPAANLIITEISSTQLSWSWFGGPTNGGTQTGFGTLLPGFTHDAWSFDVPNAQIVTTLGGTQDVFVDWKENDFATTSLVNTVRFFQYGPASNGSTVTVFGSDILRTQGYPLMENGGVYSYNPPIPGGLTAQYIDNADRSESAVPESGSTVVLLLISTAALLGVARRHLHPAA
ncbi:MAG: hypothetical protein ACXWBP_00005 [Limisphaerales bacterium]